jgi:hypothetical protein
MQRVEHSAMDLIQEVGRRVGMGDGIVCWAVRE